MRNPKSLKDGHGLPECIAYCNIRSGITPFLRADRFAVAVVLPPSCRSGGCGSASRSSPSGRAIRKRMAGMSACT
ncbi:hypothetical protein PMI09_04855 [Rhizobium sp. CF122]|uniref:hypothetical protein n=1 Tax=Rhizobium sp. CF122 TaxID=1144312 RepID=UPI000271871A|nr:hypothetical protein [Rhizobium sp. CF122]EJL50818.1 hypothetical protein PMI09_04855 [Rhizobium sp. CF122]